jgi:glycogen debranching enzyme
MIKCRLFESEIISNSDAVLLTNESGDYFYTGNSDLSKYQGLCFNNELDIYKTLDKIKLKDSAVKEIIYSGNNIEILTDKGNQVFTLMDDGLVYECNSDSESEFVFDCRRLFDMSVFGRYYNIFVEEGIIIIKFNKRNDSAESSRNEYEMYVAIKADNTEIKKIERWAKPDYMYDIKRGDSEGRFVFNVFSLKIKKSSVAYSLNKDEAIKRANSLYDSNSFGREIKINKKTNYTEINQAYNLSVNALSNLYKKKFRGIYAGIPWFMQFWTRDTGISLNALFKTNSDAAKEIILNYLSNIREDGLLPNRFPSSELDSIDSTGLVFFAVKNNIKYFTSEELNHIYSELERVIEALEKNHFAEGFLVNKEKETWMDTASRGGARIEIQALFLSMLSLVKQLAEIFNEKEEREFYSKKENDFCRKVKKNFYKKSNLMDGIEDETIRPNVFLAYYFYPELLSKKQWESVFEKTLLALFLGWGGLSSIDTRDQRFTDVHTGMDDKSYHSGDSWYFINNIAALCLSKVNKTKFSEYIDKIAKASTYEILNSGIFGYHAEISSAGKQESNGCLAQAWSSAMYIDMIDKIYS